VLTRLQNLVSTPRSQRETRPRRPTHNVLTSTDGISSLEEAIRTSDMDSHRRDTDPVNHPAHYTSHPSGVEAITITQHHNFCVGNAIKYLWRAGLKDESKTIEDLNKAVFYINQEIERLSK
jgi:hypothetical protein